MKFLEKYLQVKTSTLPGAGKGLFTKKFIPAGTVITEYKGKISTWAAADHDDGKNPYIFYISSKHVIDAKGSQESLAHFANDARGIKRVNGISNNAEYDITGQQVYIVATKDIEAGSEIFVGYGKQYWDIIKKNKLF